LSASPPLAARVFQVRFGPDKPARGDAWPNNLRLTGSGTVEVTADAVRVLDARNEAPEKERTFAMADIANVGFAQKDNVVALRTRSDQREVLLWLASAEEVRALLELLPKTTTPDSSSASASTSSSARTWTPSRRVRRSHPPSSA
jgi:hypothetical protein